MCYTVDGIRIPDGAVRLPDDFYSAPVMGALCLFLFQSLDLLLELLVFSDELFELVNQVSDYVCTVQFHFILL